MQEIMKSTEAMWGKRGPQRVSCFLLRRSYW